MKPETVKKVAEALGRKLHKDYGYITSQSYDELAEAAIRAVMQTDEVRGLINAASAVLYHDERGQGVGYSEAMNAMHKALSQLVGRPAMMIGDYPCCGGSLMIELPEQTPTFAKDNCEHCGAVVWYRFSRLDPKSWTEDAFLAEHDIDEEKRTITPKEASHD